MNEVSVSEPNPTSDSVSGTRPQLDPSRAPLTVRGARKSFAHVDVLKGVDLSVAPGEIHALVGSNGSGKSTFVRLVTGTYSADKGTEIQIYEKVFTTHLTPTASREMGVRAVHQEAPLIAQMTVAEHFGIENGFPRGPLGFVRRRVLDRRARESLERVEASVDPHRLAGELSTAERAQVALALAMANMDTDHGLLVLDEATALLPVPEAKPILERVSNLAKAGLGVLIVTHRLAEVSEYAHRTTVLRDGEVVLETGPSPSHDELVNAMVGRMTDRAIANHHERSGKIEMTEHAVLAVRDLRGPSTAGVSFEVKGGEILGLAGIVGSGTSEVARMISGAEPRLGGEIEVEGTSAPKHWTPKKAIAAGVSFVPQDRHAEGGVLTLNMNENIVLPRFGKQWGRRKEEVAEVEGMIDRLDVHPRDLGKPFAEFSGGNQQKALLGKWLLLEPKVLVLDDPTYGVDPNARETLLHELAGLADQGAGVVVISTEPEQLARICDRVLVMRSGEISAELLGEKINETEISLACFS